MTMYRPGDIVYEQYAQIFTIPISANLAIEKGRIYSVDGSGHLIVPTMEGSGANAQPDLRAGVWQAMEDVAADATAGNATVQCLGLGSRIVMQAASAGQPHGGDRVELLKASNTAPTKWDVRTEGDPSAVNYIGRCVEVASFGTDNAKKFQAADNDYVIIGLGLS